MKTVFDKLKSLGEVIISKRIRLIS